MCVFYNYILLSLLKQRCILQFRNVDYVVVIFCCHGLHCRRTCYVPRDNERKARREIANSNERRRMQSINAGFQALRRMLQPRDGEKLSKVVIAIF